MFSKGQIVTVEYDAINGSRYEGQRVTVVATVGIFTIVAGTFLKWDKENETFIPDIGERGALTDRLQPIWQLSECEAMA